MVSIRLGKVKGKCTGSATNILSGWMKQFSRCSDAFLPILFAISFSTRNGICLLHIHSALQLLPEQVCGFFAQRIVFDVNLSTLGKTCGIEKIRSYLRDFIHTESQGFQIV